MQTTKHKQVWRKDWFKFIYMFNSTDSQLQGSTHSSFKMQPVNSANRVKCTNLIMTTLHISVARAHEYDER